MFGNGLCESGSYFGNGILMKVVHIWEWNLDESVSYFGMAF